MKNIKAGIYFIFMMSFYLACIASWVTSWISSIRHGKILFAAIDFVIPPIGVIHGLGIIFNWW